MKKIITAKAEVTTTPAKKQTIKKATPDRWNQTYDKWWMHPATVKDRQDRGDLIRYINACAPGFQGAHKLSINDLNDVKMSISVCQINRICYGK